MTDVVAARLGALLLHVLLEGADRVAELREAHLEPVGGTARPLRLGLQLALDVLVDHHVGDPRRLGRIDRGEADPDQPRGALGLDRQVAEKAVEQGGLLDGTGFGVPDRLGAELVEPLVRKRSVIGQR
jgi:hypothetical protein